MLKSADYRKLINGKRYQTSTERTMSNHGSTEELVNKSSSKNVEGEVPEFQMLTQEAVNEQIRGFIAPQARQLEELTWLVQGMTTSWHPNSYPRTELGTISSTAMPQSGTESSKLKQIFLGGNLVTSNNFQGPEMKFYFTLFWSVAKSIAVIDS